MPRRPTRKRERREATPRLADSAAPETTVVDDVLRLQHAVGNRSVSMLLRVVSAAAGVLTPVQVRDAVAWYRARPDRYTPDINARIQAQVGVDQTGKIDEPTVQAVASFQQANPPLWVDGKAGPRTLPAAFPVGLAKKTSVATYVKTAKGVQADWVKLKTAGDRAAALTKAVNAQLVAANVPACQFVVKDLGNDAGQLDFATWTLQLGQGPFSKATLTDAEAADIADTVFHEARHAEQWHMMARMLAGKGKSAKAITTEMSIPANIAADAFSKPFKKGSMDALEAEGWYDSVYGAQSAARDATLNELDAAGTARKKARAAFEAKPSAANKARLAAANKRLAAAYQRYLALPEEADANRVGADVTAEYLKGL